MVIFFYAPLFIWIVILSWIVYKTRKHYFQLVSSTNKKKIDEILETLIKKDARMTEEIETAKEQLKKLAVESKTHLQKVGLIRFNPFKMLGGDQSFVLAILDESNNGLVINYIYTKEGLRVYTKKVKEGKGEEYELSEEEKKAIAKSNY